MAIEISCPSCNRRLRVQDDFLGRLVKCPSCTNTFTATSDEPPPGQINDRGEIDRREPPAYDDAPQPEERRGVSPEPAPAGWRRDREDDRRGDRAPDDRGRGGRRRDWEDEDHPYRFDRRSEALSAVAGPAISLMIVGGLAIALSLLGAVGNIFLYTAGPAAQGMPEEERMIQLVANVGSALFGLLWGGLILFGAMKMKKLESYGLAMTATIVAMLPCNGCCILGLPFGIWSLTVLNQPNVKEAFR